MTVRKSFREGDVSPEDTELRQQGRLKKEGRLGGQEDGRKGLDPTKSISFTPPRQSLMLRLGAAMWLVRILEEDVTSVLGIIAP